MKYFFNKRNLLSYTLLVMGCSIVGLLAPLHWTFDLFNHFRIQGLLAAIVLFSIAIFFDKRSAYLAFFTILLNIALIGQVLYATRGVASYPEKNNLSLVAANVLTNNRDYQAVIKMVEKEDPDILVLTEINKEWDEQLSSLKMRYPYVMGVPQEDNFGMMIYARYAFTATVPDLGLKYKTPLILADFDNFKVIVAHPVPPMNTDYAEENRLYLEGIAKIASETSLPVIVSGDLNSTLWSYTIKPLVDSGLKRVNPLGISYTWPVGAFPLAIQIDHIFAKGIQAGDFKVLSNIGSDHFPVRADMTLPAEILPRNRH